jgi:hypothetical protein
MLVALAADGDRQAREQTNDEHGEQDSAVELVLSLAEDHRAASSPGSRRNRPSRGRPSENTMARREAGHGAVA